MMSPRRLTQIAVLLAALNMAGLALVLWVVIMGVTWGTVFFLIFFSAGFWLAYLSHNKRWPR